METTGTLPQANQSRLVITDAFRIWSAIILLLAAGVVLWAQLPLADIELVRDWIGAKRAAVLAQLVLLPYAISFALPLLPFGLAMIAYGLAQVSQLAPVARAMAAGARSPRFRGHLLSLSNGPAAFARVLLIPIAFSWLFLDENMPVRTYLVNALRFLSPVTDFLFGVVLSLVAFVGGSLAIVCVALFLFLLFEPLRWIALNAMSVALRLLRAVGGALLTVAISRARARRFGDLADATHGLLGLVGRLFLGLGLWVLYGISARSEMTDSDGPSPTRTPETHPHGGTGKAPVRRGWLDVLRGRNRTPEGQPIYRSRSGEIAAAWQTRVGEKGPVAMVTEPANGAPLRAQEKDAANRLLAKLVPAIVQATLIDALRHGNQQKGRMGPDEEGSAPPVPFGTRAFARLAVVRGLTPGQPIGDTPGAKIVTVVDIYPPVTNDTLRKISEDTLAANIGKALGRSAGWVLSRLTVGDDDAADDLENELGIDVPGIVMSFDVGPVSGRSAASSQIDDDSPFPM